MNLSASDLSGATADAFEAAAIGDREPDRLGPVVRRRLLDLFCRRTGRSGSAHCVVFGQSECAHLLPDGATLAGRVPPKADTLDPRDFDAVAIR